jgi:putative ABC transport system ATP-binding protein
MVSLGVLDRDAGTTSLTTEESFGASPGYTRREAEADADCGGRDQQDHRLDEAVTEQVPRAGSDGAHHGVGFVFQTSNLISSLTAIDQVRLPTTFGKIPGARDPRELLEEVGMAHKARRRPHQLSGGERQRVGIARALVTRPEVLLVDEPTAALDRRRSQEVVALLAAETKTQGLATVMVTHDHDVLHHCDRVHEMIDGRLGATALR